MSASSPSTVLVVTNSDINIAKRFPAERVVFIGGKGEAEKLMNGRELVILEPGELTQRRLLELLVALSSGVDQIIASCRAVEYSPVGEAILAYVRIVDGLKALIYGDCCKTLPILPGVECQEVLLG